MPTAGLRSSCFPTSFGGCERVCRDCLVNIYIYPQVGPRCAVVDLGRRALCDRVTSLRLVDFVVVVVFD